MTKSSTILQVVPRAPGIHDAVGDYAFTLARKLRKLYSRETIFVVNEAAHRANDFEILSPLGSVAGNNANDKEFQHVILHYVNYGYEKRGIPFELLSLLRELRRRCPGRFLTIFHELYASGPPWKSAFWLRPFQMRIAKKISRISDACVVSSDATLRQLKRLTPNANIRVHPVFSNFGEPLFSTEQLAQRDSHRWAICGGTALVEKSLRSLLAIRNTIPEDFSPRELFVIGGNDNSAVRSLLPTSAQIKSHYHPRIDAEEASRILSACSFAWLDYFHRPDVPAAAILKSSAFAAACAHGVIPVLPHSASTISVADDQFPGPFFINQERVQLPQNRQETAAAIYEWYRRRAASEHLAAGIAQILGLTATN